MKSVSTQFEFDAHISLPSGSPISRARYAAKMLPEVSGRNAYVYDIALKDLVLFDKIAVGGNAVDDLRREVRPQFIEFALEKREAFFLCTAGIVGICEYLLDPGLRIVEIAAHSAYKNIVALLGDHLTLLHGAYTVARIEYGDLHARNVAEALERRLSGVARGGDENMRKLSFLRHGERAGEKARHDLKRHVLECTGGTVPKLKRSRSPHRGIRRAREKREIFLPNMPRRSPRGVRPDRNR